MSYYNEDPEWAWLFHNALDWETIIPLYHSQFPSEDGIESKEEFMGLQEELIKSISDWSADSISKKSEALDRKGAGEIVDGFTIPGPELKEIYKEGRELGLFGLPLPRVYGGMELPQAPHFLGLAFLARACCSTSTQLAFFSAIGDMLSRFADDETKKRLIPQIALGEISGAMCLTEPGSGSDVGALKTTATAQSDGTYLLNGTKCFITNGGGGIGLVLARIKGDPEGTKGISMFLTEQSHPSKEGPNFRIAKNEDKMGMHGSFTTEVVYEDTVATLIGKPCEGFNYMLHLMNGARIGVAFQSLGILEASIKYALKYADERVQFGKPISQLPLMRRNLDDLIVELNAIRAFVVDAASYFDIFQRLELKMLVSGQLNEEEERMFNEASMWTRKKTPLVKYYACEATTLLSVKTIQVLGGYGFMKDYPVERYHRDSFGPLLYEGTSQIQALMALKDLMKYILKDPKKFFSGLFFGAEAEKKSKASKDFRDIQLTFKRKLMKLIFLCLKPETIQVLDFKKWMKEEKVDKLMTHAETLCQGLSYVETLRVLAKHSLKDVKRESLYFDYKRLVLPRLDAIYRDWTLRT